jgi:hypothetical protein
MPVSYAALRLLALAAELFRWKSGVNVPRLRHNVQVRALNPKQHQQLR